MTTTTDSVFPTSTQYYNILFTNLGPLTSTFTAPSSCATVNTDNVLFVQRSQQPAPLGKPKCLDNYWSKGDCIPSGTDIDNWVMSSETATVSEKYQGAQLYHSPGIACPEGWNTVGLIAKNNGTMTVSGYFTEWPKHFGVKPSQDKTSIRALEPTVIWDEFLHPSQTVAFCGPSGYDVHPVGVVVSTLGAYKDFNYTTWCDERWAGSPNEGPKTIYDVSKEDHPAWLSFVHPETWAWSTSTFVPTNSQDLAAMETLDVITRQEVIPIVYEQSDLDNAATNTGTEAVTTTNTGTETGAATEETSSATTAAESAGVKMSVRSLVPVLTVLVGVFAGNMI